MHPVLRVRALLLVGLVGCGNDHADPDDVGTPTYIADVAAIMQARCNSCHGASTTVAEVQNCVRLDRWDSVSDSKMLCTNTAMTGLIFGVHDAAEMMIDEVVTGRMPFGDPAVRWHRDGDDRCEYAFVGDLFTDRGARRRHREDISTGARLDRRSRRAQRGADRHGRVAQRRRVVLRHAGDHGDMERQRCR